MKHISKIILSIWIICGLAAGNAYSFAQSYGSRNTNSLNVQLKKTSPSIIGISTEYHKKHADALIECENELEDDNEKLFSELFPFSDNNYRQSIYLAHYSLKECKPRSNSLNILYCVFRI